LERLCSLASPQYNGNISNQLWGASAPNAHTFTYSYDKLNRLINGTATGMSESLTYDEMGNITSMNRDGQYGQYNYNGNGNRLHQIINGALATQAYSYDDNGNVTYDGRNQKTISYNILNLPQTVSGGVTYTYDATGRKLKKQSTTTTHYVNGIQYTGGTIDFIQTEEGRALNMAGTYKYEYNLKDHLGNVRYSFDI
jgi:YD repeat-containing protein